MEHGYIRHHSRARWFRHLLVRSAFLCHAANLAISCSRSVKLIICTNTCTALFCPCVTYGQIAAQLPNKTCCGGNMWCACCLHATPPAVTAAVCYPVALCCCICGMFSGADTFSFFGWECSRDFAAWLCYTSPLIFGGISMCVRCTAPLDVMLRSDVSKAFGFQCSCHDVLLMLCCRSESLHDVSTVL